MIQTKAYTVNGIAEAKLTYPATCIWHTFTVEAETNGGIVSGTFSASYPAVAPVVLKLSGPSSVSPNGGYVYVSALLKDENGDGLPIKNSVILFSSSIDNVTFSTNPCITDINGMCGTTVYIPALPVKPDNTTEERKVVITGQSGTAIGTLSITQSP